MADSKPPSDDPRPDAPDRPDDQETVAERIEDAVDAVSETIADGVEVVEQKVDRAVRQARIIGGRMTRYMPRIVGGRRFEPGAAPGIDLDQAVDETAAAVPTRITVHEYGPEMHLSHELTVDEFADFLRGERPPGVVMRWVDISGLNRKAVKLVARAKGLHPLAVEDVLNIPQRPKVEEYENETFVVLRMLMLEEEGIRSEQVSLFARPGLIITFQETPGDVWNPIRARINNPKSRIRSNDAGYLLYALIDAVVDFYFPILEYFGDRIEHLEQELIENPRPDLVQEIHTLKRELLLVRRAVWPKREVVLALQQDVHDWMGETAQTFLRDVYDHAVHVLDLMETYREMVGGLSDLYLNYQSNRMNEIMKVLTIMASLFIPITFIAGVFGMNFENFPEVKIDWMYPWGFWIACIAVVAGMLGFFKWKKWI